MNRERTFAVGAMLPPPPGGSRAIAREQELDRGRLAVASRALEAVSTGGGAASARSARTRLRTRLPRTSFPPRRPEVGVDDRDHRDAVVADLQRFPTTCPTPAGHDDAHAEGDYSYPSRRPWSVVVMDMVAGDHDSFCGANGRIERVRDDPRRFSRHSLFTIARFPPAFVPEYPRAWVRRARRDTASHGLRRRCRSRRRRAVA